MLAEHKAHTTMAPSKRASKPVPKPEAGAGARAGAAASRPRLSAVERAALTDAPRVTRFPSGLAVASDAMAEAESVTLGLWVRAGAGDEGPAENGLAHLLEHMVFKGTKNHDARGIVERIEDVGGWINAATGREATSYECKVPPEELPRAVALLSELFLVPKLDEADLEAEREVVLQELGQAEDTPDDVIFDRFQAAAWPDHPMGRSILGSPRSLKSFTRASLEDFRRRHYRPEKALWTAAGRVDHERLAREVERHFAGAGAEAGAAVAKETGNGSGKNSAKGVGNGARRGAEDGAEEGEHIPPEYIGGFIPENRPLAQLHLVWGCRGLGRLDDGWQALTILSQILGGGMSSRLFQELREEAGLAYAVHSFLNPLRRDGLFGIYAGCEAARGPELLERLRAGLAELAKTPPSEAECDRARAQIKSGVLFSRERSESRMESLAMRILAYGAPRPLAEILSRLDAVTPAELQQLAARLFSEQPTLVAMGPLPKAAAAKLAPFAEA